MNKKLKILVLGGSGLLGSRICKKYFSNSAYELYSPTSHQLDLTQITKLHEFVNSVSPDVVINSTGLTNVDYCEHNVHEAYLKNILIAENLKEIKKKNHFYLIHISTDHFYEASEEKGKSTESEIHISNVYALTKLIGDQILGSLEDTVVMRTNFFGKSISSKKSFTDWIYDSAIRDSQISLFDDVFFSPLHISTVLNLIELLIEKRISGTFNFGSSGGVSKYEFAKYFLNKIAPDYKNYKIDKYQVKNDGVKRPRNMIMDNSNAELVLSFKFESVFNELDKAIGEYQ